MSFASDSLADQGLWKGASDGTTGQQGGARRAAAEGAALRSRVWCPVCGCHPCVVLCVWMSPSVAPVCVDVTRVWCRGCEH